LSHVLPDPARDAYNHTVANVMVNENGEHFNRTLI
jgi:hypothetical protein